MKVWYYRLTYLLILIVVILEGTNVISGILAKQILLLSLTLTIMLILKERNKKNDS